MKAANILDPHRGCRRALDALGAVIASDRDRHKLALADVTPAAIGVAQQWLEDRAKAYLNDAAGANPTHRAIAVAVAAELRQAGVDVEHLMKRGA